MQIRPFAVAVTTAVLATAAAGCRDATAPRPAVQVAVTVDSVVGPTVTVDSASGVTIACEVVLRAEGAGSAGDTAVWRDALLRWYEGADRSRPVDTLPVQRAVVLDEWGAAGVAAGEVRRSRWGFHSSRPFEVGIELRYWPAPGTDALRSNARFACGPAVDATTPPPWIAELATIALDGELASGSALEVRYTARSDAGVRQTTVALSGPCTVAQSHWEDLATSVSRAVRLVIPDSCAIGVPASVRVEILDGASRVGSREVATGLAPVDRTPPTLHIPYYRYGPNGRFEAFAGTFFTGETMSIVAWAADNHRLASIGWEELPTGTRDSLRVSGTSVDTVVRIRVPPEWNGPIQLLLWARDSVGLSSDVIASLADSLLVFPTVERPYRLTNTYGTSLAARVDTLRQRVLLLQQGWHRVLALDLATGAQVGSVEVPDYPTAFDGSPGGDSLLVLLPNTRALAVVDLRDLSLPAGVIHLTALDSARGDRLRNLAVAANGKVFVSWQDPGGTVTGLLEVDLRTLVQRQRTDVGDGGPVGAGDLRSSLDHTTLWLGANGLAQRYHPDLDRFDAGMASPIPTSMDRSGSRLAIGRQVYDASLQYQRTVWSPDPFASATPTLSADGETLYYAIPTRGILRGRVSDGTLLDRTAAPTYVESLWPSADGKTLVGILAGGGTVALIDVR